MSENQETLPPMDKEVEKKFVILRSVFIDYKNKGLNPRATIEMDGCLSQVYMELRENGVISPDTITQIETMISKYAGEKGSRNLS